MSAFPWWFELTMAEPRARFGKCPKCAADVDSTDVLCPQDDVSLLGSIVSEEETPWIVNGLRAATTMTALAMGYLGWAWPAYLLAVALGVGLAALFTRNHALPSQFFIGGCALFTVLHWILMSIGDGKYLPAAGIGFFTLAAIGEVGFLVAFTLAMADDRKSWNENFSASTRTILIGSASMTVAAFLLLALLAVHALTNPTPTLPSRIALYLCVVAGSIGTIGLLSSAIAYTLNAPAFPVTNPWTYRSVLHAISVPRLPVPPPRHVHGPFERVGAILAANSIAFANRLLSALEGIYNKQICSLVNGIVRTTVAIGNGFYRMAVKTGRHTHRTASRLGVLARESATWAWTSVRRFALSFAAPALLCWLAVAQAWKIAAQITGYVRHTSGPLAPLAVALRIVLFVAFLAIAAGLLLRAPAGEFATKFVNVFSAFAANAFLFFVALAWTLGLIGMITHGPYRIGWVTMASTAAVVGILVLAWRKARPTVAN